MSLLTAFLAAKITLRAVKPTPPVHVHVTVNTPGSPLWLTFLTLGISVVAVMIAAWQSLISRSENRRNRPRTKVSADFISRLYTSGNEPKRVVMISVRNLGRESTTVIWFHVQTPNAGISGPDMLINGPEVPYRLEGYSSVRWAIDAAIIMQNEVDVHIDFGHGPSVELHCLLDKVDFPTSHTTGIVYRIKSLYSNKKTS
jgi:hypothetical protein